MQREIVVLVVGLVVLAGCSSAPKSPAATGPASSAHPAARTIHLRATVVDLEQDVVPGFTANLWAFCFAAADAGDAASKGAIESWTPLPGDRVANLAGEGFVCSVPGPTIRVHQGDHIIVDFSNPHVHSHSIHWHGQFVPWQSDGTPGVSQDSIVQGGVYRYDFIAKKAGTLWYHCHVDGQEHIMKGLYGAFIVEPADASQEPKDIAHEYVWILATANHAELMQIVPGPEGQHATHGAGCKSGDQGCEEPVSPAGDPDLFFINGHSFPLTMDQKETLLKIKEGERIRLRIINAGDTFETIHLHGHDMLVTHRDGNVLPAGMQIMMDTIDIGPGQRIDVVITGDNPGPWMIHTHVASHETNCGKSSGGMDGMLVYPGFEDKMRSFKTDLTATCNPGAGTSATDVIGQLPRSQDAPEAETVPVLHHH